MRTLPSNSRDAATTSPSWHRTALALFVGLVSLSAYAGAVGLTSGGLDLGSVITERLPLQSPALAGFALAIVVALPTTWAAWLVWRRDERAGSVLVVCGVLLVGWVVIQLVVIRSFSVLQLVYLVIGALLIRAGRSTWVRPTSDERPRADLS